MRRGVIYFFCKRLRCEAGVQTCVRRQKSDPECSGCKQGKKILDDYPEPVKKAERVPSGGTLPHQENTFPVFYRKMPDMNVNVKDLMKKPNNNNGGKDMAVTEKKICVLCKNEFKPTSNVQKFCPDCKVKREKKPGKPRKPGQRLKKKTTFPGGEAPMPPVPANGEYCVKMDFTPYPHLHKELLKLSREEFRTPELQLMSMLNVELQRGEDALRQ